MKQTTRTLKNIATLAFAVWMLALAFAPIETQGHRPVVETSPYTMITDCEQPSTGAVPGKALVQGLNTGARFVTSDKAIGKALEDALGGTDWKNVRVISFCK